METLIKYKIKQKTTVREEFEYWNVIYIIRRLNIFYRNHLNWYNYKQFQGMESYDFSMNVIEKIIKGERSWENSSENSFMDFCYNVARSELNSWSENKCKSMISIDLIQENKSNLHLREDYDGF